jgi:TolA-binding protein|tara:strand:+ start:702 stop:848 length:147 start_codon:yes stop_codon:yes gene_type:complete
MKRISLNNDVNRLEARIRQLNERIEALELDKIKLQLKVIRLDNIKEEA